MQPTRPRLLGLVCWVLIIGNMGGIYRTMKQLGSPSFKLSLVGYPYPPLGAEIILFGTMVIFIIAGICMYESQGWARYLYFANAIPYFTHTYLGAAHQKASPRPLQILEVEVVLFLASVVILYLPRVRRYFKPPIYLDE